MPEGSRIIRKKRAHDDPLLRQLLDKSLSADEREDVEVVKGAKSSPLIDQIASRMRAPGAPLPAPLTGVGAGGVGHQDVLPSSTVDSVGIAELHRHEGDAEGVRPYFHAHPHDHQVRHEPDDEQVTHDDRKHIGDPRHVAATRWYGAKSAGAGVVDKLQALAADSRSLRGFAEDRDFNIRKMAQQRLEENSALGHALADAALGEHVVHKAAQPVNLLRPSVAVRKGPSGLDPAILALLKDREALRPLLEHPDFNVRSVAKERMDANLAKIEEFGRAAVPKAATSSYALTPDLSKMIAAAVTKALRSVTDQVDQLSEGTLPRRRL
jgi:hypothetical protein